VAVQTHLFLQIQTEFGTDQVVVDSLEGTETLSELFEFKVRVWSEDSELDLKKWMGTEATVQLIPFQKDGDQQDPERFLSGMVSEMTQIDIRTDAQGVMRSHYQLILRPKLWLLAFSKAHRIYQNQSALDIIQDVLGRHGVSRVEVRAQSRGQSSRLYCVHYGETALHFITRLMEEEGLFYFFSHDASGHTFIIADDLSVFTPLPGNPFKMAHTQLPREFHNHIQSLKISQCLVSQKVKTMDFDYEKPSVNLLSQASGTGLKGEVYHYPGLYTQTSTGDGRSDYWLQGLEWNEKMVLGSSTIPSLCPGLVLAVQDHPRSDLNDSFVLYQVHHFVENNPQVKPHPNYSLYRNEFAGFPSKISFRLPLKTPKIRIDGTQTAIVTGNGSGDVYSDSMARVKVHFHWDVENGLTETSSCWIRVAQNWSAGGWGFLFTPRVGMEVVVTFIDGDPDRPLVIGCVYNGDHSPPYDPGSEPHYNTIKTQTLGGGGFNEFRFSDHPAQEEIYTYAQKDVTNIIQHSRYEEIREFDDTLILKTGSKHQTLEGSKTLYETLVVDGDHHLTINKGNRIIDLHKGNSTTTLDKGDYALTLHKGNMTTTLDKGDFSTTLHKGDMHLLQDVGDFTQTLSSGNSITKITGDWTLKVTGDITIEAGKNIKMKAGVNMTLKAGVDFTQKAGVNMTLKAGVDMNLEAGNNMVHKAATQLQQKAGVGLIQKAGTMLKSEGGTLVDIKAGSLLKVESGGLAIIKGALTKIN
jgi:type VI secretion system secreted protein VgrG